MSRSVPMAALSHQGVGMILSGIWDVVSGALIRTLKHTGSVESVAFSPDGRIHCFGVSRDRTICLWDVASGAHIHTLRRHTADVESVAFSPSGRTLASGGGYQNNTKLWDVASGRSSAPSRSIRGASKASRSVPMTVRSHGSLISTSGMWHRVRSPALTGHTG